MKPSLTWSYGVTTVPSRLEDGLLERTLTSLSQGGFDKPQLFVDGCSDLRPYARFGLDITAHNSNVKAYGNWYLALIELYIRNPTADRYAIFQDDFVTYRNLRRYLETVPYPGKGYCNLNTFPKNQALAPKDCIGWYPSDQRGKGAVALVFNNEWAEALRKSEHLMTKFNSANLRHRFESIDGGVVTATTKLGGKEYVHTPSLIQHTGEVSSMSHRKYPLAETFMGESYDPMELLSCRQEG